MQPRTLVLVSGRLGEGGKKERAYREEQDFHSGHTWTRWGVFSRGPHSVLGVGVGFVSVPGQPPAQTTLPNSLPPPLFSLPGEGDSGPHVEPAEREGMGWELGPQELERLLAPAPAGTRGRGLCSSAAFCHFGKGSEGQRGSVTS